MARYSAEDRFWAKVDRSPNGCWDWAGAKNDQGYGQLRVDRRAQYAHRLAYEWFVGPIPEGLHLDHLCRNRACVNPAHLEAVACRVNVLRGVGPSALNDAVTHCPQGHPYDEANTYRRPDRRGRICRTCHRGRRAQYEALDECPRCGCGAGEPCLNLRYDDGRTVRWAHRERRNVPTERAA